MSAPGKPKIGPLTSFRFFAAIGVVMCHFFTGPDSGFRQDSRFHLLATYGVMGVSFFFILSGYILTYNYAGTPARSRTLNVRSFWWKRFARVYPLYLFALLIDIPITTAHSVEVHGTYGAILRLVPTFLTNAMLLQAWWNSFFGGWNPPGWTLSVEAFFYFAFPSLSRRLAWIYGNSWKLITAKCAGLIFLGALGLGIADWEAAKLYATAGQSFNLVYFLHCNPIINTAFFVMGMILCLMEQRIRDLGARASNLLNAACGLIVVTGFMDIVFNYEFARGPRTSLACIFFCALIALGSGRGPAWLSKMLSWSPLLLLGEASYAVYLLQFPLFEYSKQLWTAAGMSKVDPTANSNLPFYMFYVMVLIGASVLVFRVLEQPARSFLQKFKPWSWMPMRATEPLADAAPAIAGPQN